jgi:anhydro-N-acetylmuramic acid kinase
LVIGHSSQGDRVKVIGLMSGTSADGVDAALVEIDSEGDRPALRLVAWDTLRYPPGLRERILAVATAGSTEEVCHLDAYLGELFAEAAARVADQAGVELAGIDLIGSHGQTIQHLPVARREGTHAVRSSLQIGEPAVIAERTGVTTVADFRPRDLAAGGEGAPLTPIVHHALFAQPDRGRVILNLGGIANVTVVPAGAPASAVAGFDTGPGNVLLDEFVRATGLTDRGYDEDGRLAAAGEVQPDLLGELLKHPFVVRRPPKSTGREAFGPAFVEEFRGRLSAARASDLDGLATLAAFTAESVVQNLRDFVFPRTAVREVVVTGGGACNGFLMRRLAGSLSECTVVSSDDIGFPGRALEAAAFAWLAYLTVTGRPGNLPAVTGARGPRILGCIVPGKGFRGLARG